MIGKSGLGFPSPVFVVVVVILAVIVIVPRQKWRQSVARSEEVRRLLVSASEESSRVEFEAREANYYTAPPMPLVKISVPAYGSDRLGSPVKPVYKCAVCFRPTTTRCAKCKAVRYCSRVIRTLPNLWGINNMKLTVKTLKGSHFEIRVQPSNTPRIVLQSDSFFKVLQSAKDYSQSARNGLVLNQGLQRSDSFFKVLQSAKDYSQSARNGFVLNQGLQRSSFRNRSSSHLRYIVLQSAKDYSQESFCSHFRNRCYKSDRCYCPNRGKAACYPRSRNAC